jgi:hypothetical protein
MRYVRLYAGPDGESHFEDVDVGLSPTGLSELYPAPGAHFLRSPVGEAIDWHPAPRRQFVVTLAGGVEVEASDGEVRRFAPGDVLLVEDVAGRGHITRVVGTVERLSLLIPLLG